MFLPGLSCSSCDTGTGHCLHSMCLQTRTTQGHLLEEPGSFPRWALLHPAATLLHSFGVRCPAGGRVASQAPVPLETLHPRVGGDLWGSFWPIPSTQNKVLNLHSFPTLLPCHE